MGVYEYIKLKLCTRWSGKDLMWYKNEFKEWERADWSSVKEHYKWLFKRCVCKVVGHRWILINPPLSKPAKVCFNCIKVE